jgi:Holliday junction resolvasome RuvABC endonuclease subunit
LDTVIGLDVATKKSHYAIYRSDGIFLDTGEVHSLAHLKALRDMYSINYACIEDIPFIPKSGFQTMKKLCESVGAMKAWLDLAKIPYTPVAVASWKMMAIGSGRATKADVKALMVSTSNLDSDLVQDCYDAAGIAIAGYALKKQESQIG